MQKTVITGTQAQRAAARSDPPDLTANGHYQQQPWIQQERTSGFGANDSPPQLGIREWARHRSELTRHLFSQVESLQADLHQLHCEMEAIASRGQCHGLPALQLQTRHEAASSSPQRERRRSFDIVGLRHDDTPSGLRRTTFHSSENDIRRRGTSQSDPDACLHDQRQSKGLSRSNTTDTFTGDGTDTMEAAFVAETLPIKWPSSLRRREGLEVAAKNAPARVNHGQGGARVDSKGKPRDIGRWRNGCLSRLLRQIREPESKLNAIRTCFSTLLLLWDAVLIPYILGFDVDIEGWVADQLFVTAPLWTIDICLSFLQGFEDEGQLQLGYRAIAWRYFIRGFGLDAFVVALDWTTAFIVKLSNGVRSANVARILRLTRLVGLLRLRRVSEVVVHSVFAADIEAGNWNSLFTVIWSILGFMVLFNHFQACAWAYVGKHAPTDTGSHWIDMSVEVGDDVVPYQDLNSVYKYTSIFHWHMAQLTVGNQGIYTANTFERLFNITGLLIALMMACTVVSTLSATLVNYQMSVRSRTQQLRVLQQYLAENQVSSRTFNVAVKQAKERVRKSSRLTEKDVAALTLLSTTLRSTLRYEISIPFLSSMPLLRLWTSLEPTSAQQLCKVASSFEIILPNEVLFEAGEEAGYMYYLASGKGEYHQQPRTSTAWADTSREVGDKKIWMSEAAFYSYWIHVGTFEALTPCEIFKIACHKWPELLPAHHPFKDVACSYAAVFYRCIASAKPPHASWPDDLQVPYTRYSHLVASMDTHVQQIIGMDALQEAHSTHQIPERKVSVLQEQVKNGQSVLFLDDSTQIKRVTSGVCLEIKGMNGKFFLQIGKIKQDGEVTPSCMIPGHISDRRELPVESAKRLLDSKLAPLAPFVELSAPTQETETRMSQEFGIYTEYMQLKFVGELPAEFHLPAAHMFGDSNVTVKSCLRALSTNGVGEMSSPQAFMFPGDKKGTSYCFAWLSHEELSELKKRGDLVTWWLQEVHEASRARLSKVDEGEENLKEALSSMGMVTAV